MEVLFDFEIGDPSAKMQAVITEVENAQDENCLLYTSKFPFRTLMRCIQSLYFAINVTITTLQVVG